MSAKDRSDARRERKRRARRRRMLRALGRMLRRRIGGLARLGWRVRLPLAPAYTAAAIYGLGAVLHAMPDGERTAVVPILVSAGWLLWRTWGRQWWNVRAGLSTSDGDVTVISGDLAPVVKTGAGLAGWQHAALWTCWGTAAALVETAALRGVTAPLPGLLLVWTVAAAAPWWWSRRVVEPEVAAEAPVDVRIATWERHVAKTNGAVPRSTLDDVVDIADTRHPDKVAGWSAEVILPAGDLVTDNVRTAHARIAGAYGADLDNLIVDRSATRRADRARITLMLRNAAEQESHYDQTWQTLKNGCVPYAVYPDGTCGWTRVWQPGSGPTHELYSGDSGSGKSRGMELAITQSVSTGHVIPMVGDPQGGASMPAWAGIDGKALWAAGDLDGIEEQVYALENAVNARGELMATLPWTDEDGIRRRGLMAFDPEFMLREHGMAIIEYTLDEAPDILADKTMADVLTRIARKARKCGIKLRLGTQYPAMDQLGNRVTIRQQLAGGNIVSFRTSIRGGKDLLLPAFMPDPYDIPKEKDGNHTLGWCVLYSSAPGSSRSSYSRSAFIRNGFKWADQVTARMPDLDKLTADALGVDLAAWKARRAGADIDHSQVRPTREVITATAGQATAQTTTPAAPVSLAGRVTARAAILAYLQEHRYARTGVIEHALQIPLSTVSTTCKRLAKEGLIGDAGHGRWAAITPAGDTTDDELHPSENVA